jgi:hypothetical protein
MDERTKEIWAKQRAAANRQAKAGGVDARREYLRTVLKTLDAAIVKDPDSDLLKSQRTELAGELHRLGMPDELGKLRERLADIEATMADSHAGLSSQQMLDLVAEHDQLLEDLASFGG